MQHKIIKRGVAAILFILNLTEEDSQTKCQSHFQVFNQMKHTLVILWKGGKLAC